MLFWHIFSILCIVFNYLHPAAVLPTVVPSLMVEIWWQLGYKCIWTANWKQIQCSGGYVVTSALLLSQMASKAVSGHVISKMFLCPETWAHTLACLYNAYMHWAPDIHAHNPRSENPGYLGAWQWWFNLSCALHGRLYTHRSAIWQGGVFHQLLLRRMHKAP